MGVNDVMNTAKSGLMTSKAAISTTGHNITNSTKEGFTRQRVLQKTNTPHALDQKNFIGTGTSISRIDRVNDEYLDKQLRNSSRDMGFFQERDVMLTHVEDVFNEMNGDGLNRLMSNFFNEFRKLSNEPSSEALRQSVRESSQALVRDFQRIRADCIDAQRHIDNRVEGYVREANSYLGEVRDLNLRIQEAEARGGAPNDLLDQRDMALKKLSELMGVASHKDNNNAVMVQLKGVGPLLSGPDPEKLSVYRSSMNSNSSGKPEGALDIRMSSAGDRPVTSKIVEGKIGGLLNVRDQVISTALERLDDLAYSITKSVNQIHEQGFTRQNIRGVAFFKNLDQSHRASEFIGLSDAVSANTDNIAAAAAPSSPGDNRIAVAISGLQNLRMMKDGTVTPDDYYNSIVSDIGVVSNRNKSSLNQHQNILTQLTNMRDQISGVSIDEETTNLMQYQQIFDASAKVISVADEMLDTVLNLKKL